MLLATYGKGRFQLLSDMPCLSDTSVSCPMPPGTFDTYVADTSFPDCCSRSFRAAHIKIRPLLCARGDGSLLSLRQPFFIEGSDSKVSCKMHL